MFCMTGVQARGGQASCCSHEGTPAETSAAGEPCTIQSDNTFRPLVALAQLHSNNRPGTCGERRQVAEQGGADLWLGSAAPHRAISTDAVAICDAVASANLACVEYDDRDREEGTQTTFSRCPIAESSLPRSACPSAFCALPLTFSNQPQCPLTPSQERRCSTAAWPKAAYSTDACPTCCEGRARQQHASSSVLDGSVLNSSVLIDSVLNRQCADDSVHDDTGRGCSFVVMPHRCSLAFACPRPVLSLDELTRSSF